MSEREETVILTENRQQSFNKENNFFSLKQIIVHQIHSLPDCLIRVINQI